MTIVFRTKGQRKIYQCSKFHLNTARHRSTARISTAGIIFIYTTENSCQKTHATQRAHAKNRSITYTRTYAYATAIAKALKSRMVHILSPTPFAHCPRSNPIYDSELFLLRAVWFHVKCNPRAVCSCKVSAWKFPIAEGTSKSFRFHVTRPDARANDRVLGIKGEAFFSAFMRH